MKKNLQNLFTGCLIAAVSVASAQPTLTASGTNPAVGDNYSTSSCAAFSQGASGANQTWNNSSLVSTGSTSTTCVTVGSTTNGSSFPNANVASQSGSNISYFKTSATGMQNYGYDAGGTLFLYSNPEDQLHFPCTYNSTFTDNFAATFTTSGYTTYRHGSTTVTADAYGTLTTPTGTYTNCMRIHFVQAYSDSLYVGMPTVITYSNDEYIWYKDGIHAPIAYTFSFVSNGSTSSGAGYLSTALGVNEVDNNISMFSVYPNPASETINLLFNLKNANNAQLNVFNSIGQQLSVTSLQNLFEGDNTVSVDVATLPEGIYFVQLILDNGNIQTRRFVVTR